MSCNMNKSKRKKKWFYQKTKKSKQDYNSDGSCKYVSVNLYDNLSGFLVTCNSHEYQCLLESYNICNETADKLYGQFNEPEPSNLDDIEECIQKEIDCLNNVNQRRFIQVKTKCKNLLFIKSNDEQIDCTKLMKQLLQNIEISQKQNVRFIQRFIPVQATFKADQEKLGDNFELNFDRLAPKQARSYAIQCRVRNNSGVNSEKLLLEQLVLIVKMKRPHWYLNLNEPQILIALNVVQKAVCLSLIDDYHKFAKYNLVEYFRKCTNAKSDDLKESICKDGNNIEDSNVNLISTEDTEAKLKSINDSDEKLKFTSNSDNKLNSSKDSNLNLESVEESDNKKWNSINPNDQGNSIDETVPN